MGRRLRVILLILLALVAVEELLLPLAIGGMVAKGMESAIVAEKLSADVSRRPAFAMLGGSFDMARISAENAKVDKIVFNKLEALLREVQVDKSALFSERKLVVQSAKDVELSAEISQEELARFLNSSVKGVKDAKVTVSDGKVKIAGSYLLGGIASLSVTLDGRVAGDGQKLKYVTERFMINNASVGNIGGNLLTEIQLADLSKLPFKVGVRKVTSENGVITVLADNHAQ